MKKSTTILLVLLLVSAIAAYFLLKGEDESISKIDVSDRTFAVEKVEDIKRITITERNGSVKDFRKEDGRWNLNKEIPVSDYRMVVLLQTLGSIQVDHIPHPNARKNILDEIARIGIQVEVYTDNSDTPEKAYYVGGSTIDEYGTYYLMKGKKQPYVVLVKGVNGSIRSRFTFKAHEWTDAAIFHDELSDIETIKVDYPQEKSESFELYDLREEPKIRSSYRLTEKQLPIIKPRLDAYLQGFLETASEYTYNDPAKKESITKLVPFVEVSYTTKDDEERWIKLYALNELNQEKFAQQKLANQGRIERYYAWSSDDRFMLVQRVVVGEWLRPYDFFVK